jgi:hypothetical protein
MRIVVSLQGVSSSASTPPLTLMPKLQPPSSPASTRTKSELSMFMAGRAGKPIPYWLYKLHGLNLEFKCEICGNYSYWGPRAFERHFQEFVEAIARV